jgi:hypothetical protein
VAAANGGGIYTRQRSFARYVFDEESGLIRGADGAYLSAGVNTNLARVASPFPLRLIMHGDAAGVKLLQRVFVGQSSVSTNTVVASLERLLNPDQIASARRISASHLPFSSANNFWQASGSITPGTVLNFTVPLSYNDQSSNPFLHTFHPDHDNLAADFKSVQPMGTESFDVSRQIRLTFTSPGTDFKSLTASQLTRSGMYEETITMTGKAGGTRQYRLAGAFTLQRISSIDTLTTQ